MPWSCNGPGSLVFGMQIWRPPTPDGVSPELPGKLHIILIANRSTQMVLSISFLPLDPCRNLYHWIARRNQLLGSSRRTRLPVARVGNGRFLYPKDKSYCWLDHDLRQIRADRRARFPSDHGMVAGDVEAVSAGDDADKYVIIKKKKHDEGKGQQQHWEYKQDKIWGSTICISNCSIPATEKPTVYYRYQCV